MNTSISTVHYIPFVVTMAVHPCSIFGKEENKEWGKSKGKKRRWGLCCQWKNSIRTWFPVALFLGFLIIVDIAVIKFGCLSPSLTAEASNLSLLHLPCLRSYEKNSYYPLIYQKYAVEASWSVCQRQMHRCKYSKITTSWLYLHVVASALVVTFLLWPLRTLHSLSIHDQFSA